MACQTYRRLLVFLKDAGGRHGGWAWFVLYRSVTSVGWRLKGSADVRARRHGVCADDGPKAPRTSWHLCMILTSTPSQDNADGHQEDVATTRKLHDGSTWRWFRLGLRDCTMLALICVTKRRLQAYHMWRCVRNMTADNTTPLSFTFGSQRDGGANGGDKRSFQTLLLFIICWTATPD